MLFMSACSFATFTMKINEHRLNAGIAGPSESDDEISHAYRSNKCEAATRIANAVIDNATTEVS
jgi:hypothetical protein